MNRRRLLFQFIVQRCGLLSSLHDKLSTTFPQKLWKSLWISRLFALQVSENFRLLAFCTLARQRITDPSQKAASALETKPPPQKRRLYHPVLRHRRGQLLLRQTATSRRGRRRAGRKRPTLRRRRAARLAQPLNARRAGEAARHRPGARRAHRRV